MSKKVFLIDDDCVLRLMVEKMMHRIDSSLVFIPCENGRVGLDKLNDHLEAAAECIILLDLNMPILDGWGFLEEMQASQWSDYSNITLYILSSSTDKSDIERARQYACVKKFYHKPLSNQDFNKILDAE
jgi:CheY-like chemotaxis protein